jgi:PAS domain S-box-containing protein
MIMTAVAQGAKENSSLGTPISMLAVFAVILLALVVWNRKMAGEIMIRRNVEAALQESERRLNEAQKMAQLGHWIWDVRTGDVEWSEEVFSIFHLDPLEFTPQIDSIQTLSPWPEDHERDKELIRKATETHEKGTYEQRFLRPDKSIGYYHSTFQGKYDDRGNLISIVGTVQDITERRRADEALLKTGRALKILSECNQTLVRATDESELLQAICSLVVEHGGYRMAWVGFAGQDEARSVCPVAQAGFDAGYTDTVNITWADTEAGRGPTGTAIRTGRPVTVHSIPDDPTYGLWRAAAISRGYISSIALPLVANDRTFGALNIYSAEPDAFDMNEVNVLTELTGDLAYGITALRTRAERESAVAALHESEERFKAIASNTPDHILMQDCDLGYLFVVNPQLGLTEEDMVGKTDYDFLPKEEADKLTIVKRQVLETGKPVHFETSLISRAGVAESFDGNYVPKYDAKGQVDGLIGYFRNVTERKQAEEALRESEKMYRSLFENMLNGFAYCQMHFDDNDRPWDFTYLSVNSAFETLTGLKDVVGKKATDVIPDIRESDPQLLEVYGRVSKTGNPERFEMFVDSLQMWFWVSVYCPERGYFVSVFDVITKRKRAEEELALYARRMAILNRLDHVVTSSLDTGQVYDRFVKNLKELVHIDSTSVVLLDESREHWTVAMMWAGYEPIIGKGEWRDVKGSVIEWLVNQKLPLMENEIGEKGDWTDNELLRQDGIRSRVLLPLIIRGEVIGMLSLASWQPAAYSEKDLDILMPLSDQFSLALQNSRLYDQLKKQSLELEKTVEERTRQLQKANKELEAFSYSVSHDLRAPLRAVDGFSRILLEEYQSELSPDAQNYLNLVRSNTAQMGRLIDDLLTFSRTSRQALAKRDVDTAEIVRQVLEELHGELVGRKVEVIVGALLHCQADPAMLKQVFFNLISNAVKFTRKKEEAQIEIGSINNDGITTYFVKDNGVGFDMRYYGKLFGVFSRLHSESDYEGTGVGLALVQRIVHRHKGRVWAEAEVDKGATFYFTLVGDESG